MVPIYGGVVVQGHCSVEGLGSHNTNDLGIHSKVFEVCAKLLIRMNAYLVK